MQSSESRETKRRQLVCFRVLAHDNHTYVSVEATTACFRVKDKRSTTGGRALRSSAPNKHHACGCWLSFVPSITQKQTTSS